MGCGVDIRRRVIKINNVGRRQERIIGVDMTRVYNSKPKDKFHFKGVFKKWRDIADLESCPWQVLRMFADERPQLHKLLVFARMHSRAPCSRHRHQCPIVAVVVAAVFAVTSS